MKKFVSTLSGKIVAVLVFLLIVSVPVYFLFQKKSLKRELIGSFYIVPDSIKGNSLSIDGVMTLEFSKGSLQQPDSLKVYKVSNIEVPDASLDVVNVYDFEMQKQKKFGRDIEIKIPLNKEAVKENQNAARQIAVLYFNPAKKKWEGVETEINKENLLTIRTDHFSTFGIFSNPLLKNEPMMKIFDGFVLPPIENKPDADLSVRILTQYSQTQSYSNECRKAAFGIISDTYGFSSSFATLGEELAGFEWAEKFNKSWGKFGIYFSIGSVAIKIMEGKYFEAKATLLKELITYSLGEFGWSALKVANVGIFFIQYSLEKYAEKMYDLKYKEIENRYKFYNKSFNTAFDGQNFPAFIEKTLRTSKDPGEVQAKVNAEIEKYVNAFWGEFNIANDPVSADVIDALKANCRREVVEKLQPAIDEAKQKLAEERRRDFYKMREELREFFNSVMNIKVNVQGDEKEVKNLRTRVKVENDQDKWEGRTTENGSYTFPCTVLGYMTYKFPKTAELEYEGKILTQPIVFDKSRTAEVEFVLPKKQESKSSGEFDIAGSYSGTYTCIPNPECVISGTVTIQVDASGNATLKASGTGGCKYSDWNSKEVQSFDLKTRSSGYVKKLDAYNLHFEGTENKTVTYINAYETTTKSYSWNDRMHSIQLYRDGTIKSKGTYLNITAKRN